MELEETDGGRTRRLLGNWAGVAAILLLAQLFAVAGPLRAQTPSEKASDPFAVLHQSLESAANEQLALRLGQTVATHESRRAVDARPIGGELSFKQEEDSVRGGRPSAEERFHKLGVDAGGIFHEFGVPLGLLKIAQVESNWQPFALSPKGAFGLWQLMPATARRYGLRVDGTRDDRADTSKATRVAARYLRDLHMRFGDWALALAAYNAGEEAVERAIGRGASRDFWNLSQRKLLPAETRAYVPAVLASFDPSGTQRAMSSWVKANARFIQAQIKYAAARETGGRVGADSENLPAEF